MHAAQRMQRTQAAVPAQHAIPTPRSVAALITTPALAAVAALPATATLLTVAALPATATLLAGSAAMRWESRGSEVDRHVIPRPRAAQQRVAVGRAVERL